MILLKFITIIITKHRFWSSIRGVNHVIESAKIGADVVTIPTKTFKEMFNHPLTDKGLKAFLSDWQDTGQSIL